MRQTRCSNVWRMPERAWRVVSAVILLIAGWPLPLHAQSGVTLHADFLFYGDNTEFRNPFREGETIFGAAARLWGGIDVGDRVLIALGALTNQRFGSSEAFELVRPIVSLTVRGTRSTFVIGTLPQSRVGDGPDLTTPHGLLPPLQRETLTFERPYEAGLQWTFRGTRVQHDMWLNWQRLNTAAHRERFDAGAVAGVRVNDWFTVPLQFHVVHEGGQQFGSGPVADSLAGGGGVMLQRALEGIGAVTIDVHGLLSRWVPDRGAPERSRNGAGFFGRAALTRSGWRAHILFWRGDDFIKEEGDPNYLSRRRNGSLYRGVRDYAEAGLTGTFQLAPEVKLQASARVHRVEHHYEYSYRIVATANLRWRPSTQLRPGPSTQLRPGPSTELRPGAFHAAQARVSTPLRPGPQP